MDLSELIELSDSWHVWVLEYGITHAVMRLALHRGDYPMHQEVVCGGATAFVGELQGGPYKLSLVSDPDLSGKLILRDEANKFLVRADTFSLGRNRT